MSRILKVTVDEFLEIAKALSNESRLHIFKQIQKANMNVNEIAEMFGLPSSTATVSIKKLEDAGLIHTELLPGTRGFQKVLSSRFDQLVIDLKDEEVPSDDAVRYVQMPIGLYSDCEVRPTCGIVSEESIIGYLDEPRSFYEPDKALAQLIWFRQGYVEYQIPNKVPYDARLTGLEISMEVCSEAPMYNMNWPSDITVWINGIEIGTYLSPGDFGGERGLLTPPWWDAHRSQYGLLKKWRIDAKGAYIDGRQVSDVTVDALGVHDAPAFQLRIGVKPDSANVGGLNLFGAKFGNYEQDLLVRFDFTSHPKK
ncbi:ArsR/SmtB family transcription factor [Paenibacillus ginsengarvi]|uniref:Winged helix-turn-helix transcriptional regulator n=1 Tax=Paenibacillus ginsengarvi TaxID=400777 RepID=A0A3B0C9D4_9BACL|nr:winged helix-turn-helix transcriptional regulator [Paenibacillus ginsengarvi]RKN80699.1 winged helix-turn-helix transcriptional regulator [Paenibacillus ginsengarvi]